MTHILVQAVDNSISGDAPGDRLAAFKKGDPLVEKPDSFDFGSEGLPTFVRILVPGRPLGDLASPWIRKINAEIVQQNANGARIRLTGQNSGAFPITWRFCEPWVSDWGGVFVSEGTDEVVFDVGVEDALKSRNMWDGILPASMGVYITVDSFTAGTFSCTFDFGEAIVPIRGVKRRVEQQGGQVVAVNGTQATVEITGASIRDALMQSVNDELEHKLGVRRYNIDGAIVDSAIAAGGDLTLTDVQLTAGLLDRGA